MDHKIIDRFYELKWSRIYSYIFELALEKDLFLHTGDGESGKSLLEISAFLGMPLSGARIVAQCLCGLGLLKKEQDLFYNTSVTDNYLVNDKVLNNLRAWKIPRGPAELERQLKEPPRQSWYQMKKEGKAVDEVRGISSDFFLDEVRHRWRISQGENLADLFDFGSYKKLLDVGGASGGWSMGIRSKNAHLHCTVYDLPEVCRFGATFLKAYAAPEMIEFVPGDLFAAEWSVQPDIILMANVLHDWTKPDVKNILCRAYDCLSDNGKLLIYEYYFEDDWAKPLSAVYHGITVLGPNEESGFQPSYAELEELMQACGFSIGGRKNNLVVGLK